MKSMKELVPMIGYVAHTFIFPDKAKIDRVNQV